MFDLSRGPAGSSAAVVMCCGEAVDVRRVMLLLRQVQGSSAYMHVKSAPTCRWPLMCTKTS